mgnify:CR=1 FL=1
MKKNLRSVIALLLIVFNISIIFDNSFINNLNNGNVSVCSDEDNTSYNNDIKIIIFHYVFQSNDYKNSFFLFP